MNYFKFLFAEYEWELVQQRSHRSIRSVYRLLKDSVPELYIKIYNPWDPLQKIRNLIYPRTLYEARMLNRLSAAGIPVPGVKEHLRKGFASALVTHAIYPSKTLFDFTHDKQAMILLAMAVLLLKKGFYYDDMHSGNVIVDNKGKPYLLDAYEVKPIKRLRRDHIIDLLAQIEFLSCVPDEKLIEYLNRLNAVKDTHRLADAIRARSKKLNRSRIKRWIRRSLRHGSFSEELDIYYYKAFINRQYSVDLDKITDIHTDNIQNNTNVLKVQKKTQLSRVDNFCVKSFKASRMFARPYALRSWQGLLTLHFNKIGTAGPVAVILYKDRSSILITKMLNHPDLDELLYHKYSSMPLKEKRDLLNTLGNILATMHVNGIYHADLKVCNIKVSQDPLAFYFLDTDRVEQKINLSTRRRIKNMVQINTSIPVHVSRTMRFSFIKAYSKITGDDPGRLFKDVWELSRREKVVYRTLDGDHIERWPDR